MSDGVPVVLSHWRVMFASLGTPPPTPQSPGPWRELGAEGVLAPFASSVDESVESLRALREAMLGGSITMRFRLTREESRRLRRAWRRALRGPWPYASPRRDPLGSGRVAAKRRRQLATELRRRDRRAARRG